MVTLTEAQKAALSPEAVNFLSNIRHIPFAATLSPFLTSPRRIPGLRRTFRDRAAAAEAELVSKHRLQLREITIAGVPVVVIEPPTIHTAKQQKILFNVHGGGFVLGNPDDRAALTMAAELGVRVYSINYTKAPEAKFPVARDQCLAVYRTLVCHGAPGGTSSGPIDPTDIYTMGSSSGAQVLVSMLLVAQREGLPMPTAGLYLCAPALDLSGAGDSMVTNAFDRDLLPVSMLIGMASQNYVPDRGIDARDPLYSPIYADYTASFPRTVITVGTRDFALSHGVRFFWKLRDAGVEVDLLVSEGMWHGFNWDPVVPEALRARAAVVKFLERSL
ncbi:Alpha/Beta hydrolase protein [Achaetomium macrosporum]|uniref:Alpha/Beta hydrolase protein n=1 Tax=Achaetomium macrosporum TaxID=79813 RepID=A0AAN7H3I6_9PEZI|nr:Alpha/Beta hydrolase protein [Achaetomium macrosporum]